jgi:hypothetical protein
LANKTQINADGQVRLKFQFLGFKIDYFFIVLDLDYDALLGRDLIEAFHLREPAIPLSTGSFNSDSKSIDFDDGQVSSTLPEHDEIEPADQLKIDQYMPLIRKVADVNRNIPTNSYCTHELGTIRIDHKEGTIPYFKKQYALPHTIKKFLDEPFKDWLKDGYAIEHDMTKHGKHEWNTPIFGVPEEDNDGKIISVRPVMDFKGGLNNGLIDIDTWPLTNIDEMIDRCAEGGLFTELDLKRAFFQMRVHPDCINKLAFTWEHKVYLFTRAPMGLTFTASAFQRLIHSVFKDMPYVTSYVDNIWIMTPGYNYEEHAKCIASAIKRLNEVNLKLNVDKCKFFRTRFVGLGHQIDKNGRSIDPEKKRNIESIPLPPTYAALHHFLGVIGYQHHYIRMFSDKTKELKRLKNQEVKNGKTKKSSKFKGPEWDEKAIEEFHKIKEEIANSKPLKHPDYKRNKFHIAVDASTTGIGSVLYQPDKDYDLPDAKNIITYRSHSLKGSQITW